MKKLSFTHNKQFGTITGAIITMKSLITINTPGYSEQLVECHEDQNRYKVTDLIEISQGNNYKIKSLSL